MSRLSVLAVLVLSLLFVSTPIRAQEPSAALANDLAILNFALSFENTDSNYFSTHLAAFGGPFGQTEFDTAGFGSAYSHLINLANEEIAHAQLIAAVVAALGGTPAPPCTYDFSANVTDVLSYLTLGALFENTGTSAYDGGINAFTNSSLQQAAATIATVEARHASYLNELLGVTPFAPSGFDTPFTPLQAFAVVAPFIKSCPNGFSPTADLPTVRPYGVALASISGGQIVTNFTGSLATALTNEYTQADLDNDILALNYALILENLEFSFYNFTAQLFTEAEFEAANYTSVEFDYFNIILSNEHIHVDTLTAVISSLGGTPHPVCNYSAFFSTITSVADYVATAKLLENTGVSAYDGAVNAFASTALQQVAATIATIEARHAAFLNQLSGSLSFPNVTDTPLSPAEIAAAVLPLMVCPFTPQLPQVARLQVPATFVSPIGGSSGGSSSGAASSGAASSGAASSGGASSAGASSGAAGVSSSSPVTSVLGDPSFVGFNGQRFQVHGIPNRFFNLLSTPTLQFNALFTMLVDGQSMTAGQMKAARVSAQLSAMKSNKQAYALPLTTAYSHEGTFLAEMGLKFTAADGATVQVRAVAGAYTSGFATVTVNGVAVAVGAEAVQVAAGMYVTLTTPSILTIDTPAVSFTLTNADRFFNIEQATLNTPYTADSQMDGLLGQTADAEWKVLSTREFKQHMVYDYLLADQDSMSDDFVSNMYGQSRTEQAQAQ